MNAYSAVIFELFWPLGRWESVVVLPSYLHAVRGFRGHEAQFELVGGRQRGGCMLVILILFYLFNPFMATVITCVPEQRPGLATYDELAQAKQHKRLPGLYPMLYIDPNTTYLLPFGHGILLQSSKLARAELLCNSRKTRLQASSCASRGGARPGEVGCRRRRFRWC